MVALGVQYSRFTLVSTTYGLGSLVFPSNCLCQQGEAFWLEQKAALLDVLSQLSGEVIFVSNEVGHGIVPLGELSRQFVDHSGWLHQALAQQVARVEFVIAGLAQTLKREQ